MKNASRREIAGLGLFVETYSWIMVRINPTSFGLFSRSRRISFRAAFPVLSSAWAAALRAERLLTDGEIVGDGDFEMVVNVDFATPPYFKA